MDVVIFELNKQHFALPTAEVSEVLDPLPVTPLPFAPDYVDGLVNVAGHVVVQMDAATRLGVGEHLVAEKGSVLVAHGVAAASAVHVEKVLSKALIADEDITLCGVSSVGEAELVNDAVKGEFQWRDSPVLLLDTGIFSLDGIEAVDVPLTGGGLLGSTIALEKSDENANSESSDFPCVIVECNNERYAIRLHEVGEIVEVDSLTTLPHAPREIAGMVSLRGMPLLGLSLGLLLGGKNAAQPLMVVLESRGMNIALLVENVIGIERFPEDSVQSVEQGKEVEGYLIGNGESMVGLLRLDGVISKQRFAAYSQYLVYNRLENMMKKDTHVAQQTKRMLTFSVGPERCAMPLEWVERIEEYHKQTEVPPGESGLSGVVQIQGDVAPVVDLRHAMGFSCSANGAAFLVVRLEGSIWALTVDKVERVIEMPEQDIEPVKAAATDYITAVGRVNGRLISILTLEPLMAA